MKKALITGITGQDGSYLTELLCKKGYEYNGIIHSIEIIWQKKNCEKVGYNIKCK